LLDRVEAKVPCQIDEHLSLASELDDLRIWTSREGLASGAENRDIVGEAKALGNGHTPVDVETAVITAGYAGGIHALAFVELVYSEDVETETAHSHDPGEPLPGHAAVSVKGTQAGAHEDTGFHQSLMSAGYRPRSPASSSRDLLGRGETKVLANRGRCVEVIVTLIDSHFPFIGQPNVI
jgi:hypothetical protein